MWRILLVCFVLLTACSSGQRISTSTPRSNRINPTRTPQNLTAPTRTPMPQPVPTLETYTVGETISIEGHTIVLNETEIKGGVLRANFTVENQSKENLIISGIDFDAKDSDGILLEASLFDCGTSFSGKVLVGDKLKGDRCWEITNAAPFRIYYEVNLFGFDTIVWQVNE